MQRVQGLTSRHSYQKVFSTWHTGKWFSLLLFLFVRPKVFFELSQNCFGSNNFNNNLRYFMKFVP